MPVRIRREQQALVQLLKQHFSDGPELGAELGVFRGKTSEALLSWFPKLRLYMVDSFLQENWFHSSIAKTMAEARQLAFQVTEPYRNRRIILEMDIVNEAPGLVPFSLDFIFIDANKQDTLIQIETWWPKVRRGGLMIGHDYGGRGGQPVGSPYLVEHIVNAWCLRSGYSVILPGSKVWYVVK